MSLRWPLALVGVLVVPLLLAAYVLQLRRRRRGAVVFSSVALIRAAMPKRSTWKRHVPAALFLLGLTSLGVASARPQVSAKVEVSRTSIILALDVSRSMCSTDVPPNRLAVAQEAARSFVEAQPKGTRIGVVAFAGFAMVLVEPTTEREELLTAIDGLTTARGTVIGSAILRSVDVIASINPEVAPVDTSIESGAGDAFPGFDPTTGEPIGAAPVLPAAPEPKEGYVSDIVVVLTDGTNTRGIAPIDAAKQAADRRVRVYTIGFGTTQPTEMVCSAEQLGGDALFEQPVFGSGGGFQSPPASAIRQFLVADEPTLQSVANLTGGTYYKAEDADQLKGVFNKLPKDVELQSRKVELSVGFLGAGALLALVAMFLSLRWNRTP
jgi:Ca-activated chloride channel homolog